MSTFSKRNNKRIPYMLIIMQENVAGEIQMRAFLAAPYICNNAKEFKRFVQCVCVSGSASEILNAVK